MTSQQVVWKNKISENQQFRSTWLVEIDGVEHIAKKIETDDKEKLDSLVKRLNRQIRFSKILNDDEQRKICLYDTLFEGEGYVAFFRRYCQGKSLDKLMESKRYTTLDAVNLILEIARIVRIAHGHHVYHGDLKPANIVINDAGDATIIDWDTMRISDSVREELIGDVTNEEVAGTPHYMPIEQFQGAKIQPQNDVYALGVILYQLLCGETPFDKAQTNSATQMAIYKQNHEPESILVKHPELGIPSDLGRLIDESLKNDLNQRIQSVDIFIQRLETIGKISASKETVSPIAPTTASSTAYVPAKEKGKEYKLVLIGHTGSGKTVLAAGLYATQDKDFAVDDPGSKTQTGIHAINTKTIIEEGHWPAATSVGDITKLKFKLNYKGKQECISFDEYAGERIEMENFDNSIIKNPDGAFILLNPGGKQWHETRSKNSMISDMKHYIDLLSKKANNPPIALVITASDRLESDLKEFSPKFLKYVEELENSLKNKKCVYRVFHVSVSGILENQERPQLNPQHIKDPFMWLLNQFTMRAWKKRVKWAIAAIALLVVGLLIAFGGEYAREMHLVSSLKSSQLSIEKEFNEKGTKGKQELLDRRNSLVNLRNAFCSQHHFSNDGTRQGNCSASCYPSFILTHLGIHSFKDDFDKQIAELENKIDSASYTYLSKELSDAINNPTEANRKVDKTIEKWIPIHEDKSQHKKALLDEFKQKMPSAIARYEKKNLEDNLQDIIKDPKKGLSSALTDKYQQWIDSFSSALPDDERSDSLLRIKNLYSKASEAVWNDSCEEQKNKIVAFSGNSIDDLEKIVKNYLAFKQTKFLNIDQTTQNNTKKTLDGLLYNVISNVIQTKHNEAQRKLLESDVYKKPEYADELKNKVTSQFSTEDKAFVALNSVIDQKVKEGKDQWEKAKKKVVDDFIAKNQSVSSSTALDNYKEFRSENIQNPFFSNADNFLTDKVFKDLLERIKTFDYSETDHRSLKEFCAKIKSTKCEGIQKTQAYSFATAFFDMMNSTHSITINSIYVSSSYSSGAYIENCYYNVGNRGYVKLIGDLEWAEEDRACFTSSRQLPYCNCPFTVQCEPWDTFKLEFDIWKDEFGPDTMLADDYWVSFKPTHSSGSVDYDLFNDNVKLVINYKCNYKTFDEILSETK